MTSFYNYLRRQLIEITLLASFQWTTCKGNYLWIYDWKLNYSVISNCFSFSLTWPLCEDFSVVSESSKVLIALAFLMFVYLCRSVYVYKLTSFIYTSPFSSWKFRKIKSNSSEMLFNDHKLRDLLYLPESLNGSEKAHQDLLSSFRLFTFLFNTGNFIFPYSSGFPCGENFKKALSPAKLQVKEMKQMSSCGTSQKSFSPCPWNIWKGHFSTWAVDAHRE